MRLIISCMIYIQVKVTSHRTLQIPCSNKSPDVCSVAPVLLRPMQCLPQTLLELSKNQFNLESWMIKWRAGPLHWLTNEDLNVFQTLEEKLTCDPYLPFAQKGKRKSVSRRTSHQGLWQKKQCVVLPSETMEPRSRRVAELWYSSKRLFFLSLDCPVKLAFVERTQFTVHTNDDALNWIYCLL